MGVHTLEWECKHWSGSANIGVRVQTLECECKHWSGSATCTTSYIIPLHYSLFQSAAASHLWTAPLHHVPVTFQWGTGKWGESQRKEMENSAIMNPVNNIAGGC